MGPNLTMKLTTYTGGQISAAVHQAASILQKMGEGWQPHRDEYPHFFRNGERIPFDCGKQRPSFPLNTNGQCLEPGSGRETAS